MTEQKVVKDIMFLLEENGFDLKGLDIDLKGKDIDLRNTNWFWNSFTSFISSV